MQTTPKYLRDEKQTQEIFTYNIRCCENLPKRGKLLSQPTFYQDGNSLGFISVEVNYCNAKDNMALKYSRTGNNIEIREIFDSKKDTGDFCPFDIEGRIDNLKKGKYNIKWIIEDKYNNKILGDSDTEFKLK